MGRKMQTAIRLMWLFLLRYPMIYCRKLDKLARRLYSLQILPAKALRPRRLNSALARAKAISVKVLYFDNYANEQTNQSNEADFHDREVWNVCLWIFKVMNLWNWFRESAENIFPRWIRQIHRSIFRNLDVIWLICWSGSDAYALSSSRALVDR